MKCHIIMHFILVFTVFQSTHLRVSTIQRVKHMVNRGSYMSAHVLLNLLNELGKRDKM